MSRVARKLDLQRAEKRQEWRNFVEKLEISSGNERNSCGAWKQALKWDKVEESSDTLFHIEIICDGFLLKIITIFFFFFFFSKEYLSTIFGYSNSRKFILETFDLRINLNCF